MPSDSRATRTAFPWLTRRFTQFTLKSLLLLTVAYGIFAYQVSPL